jgi:cystathionine beta-lyase
VFGNVALDAAYTHGCNWLDQMLVYVKENVNCVAEFFKNRMPKVKIMRPEGTYLIWIDFRGIGLSHSGIKETLIHKAKVALNDGVTFGIGGEGFFRMNVACPQATVIESLNKIFEAFENSDG